MAKQRISYVPLEKMDAEMRKEMERCEREGTPRPESSAVRAHVKAAFWFFANAWRDLFKNGVLEHPIRGCGGSISRPRCSGATAGTHVPGRRPGAGWMREAGKDS